MNKQLIISFLILAISLCSCASSSYIPVQPTAPSDTQIRQGLDALSDEELIRKLVSTRALEAWAFQSYALPSSEEGLSALFSSSEEFSALMSRPTGLLSLKKYGPKIAAEYARKENAIEALQGKCLGSLLVHYFPELTGTLDTFI